MAWRGYVMRMLSRMTVLAAGFLFLSSSALAGPPNGHLRVAYHQLVDGKLSDSVHHIELTCWDGRCSLTTLTLNQCVVGAFYPKVERTSTEEGDLIIAEVGTGVLVVEERHTVATFKYRFAYQVRTNQDLSRDLRLKESRYFQDLISFSGAAVKQSPLLDQAQTWELRPLKGRSPEIEAKCKIALDGVPE
jgi:hypothetical protein